MEIQSVIGPLRSQYNYIGVESANSPLRSQLAQATCQRWLDSPEFHETKIPQIGNPLLIFGLRTAS